MTEATPKKLEFVNTHGLVVDPTVVKAETIRDMPTMPMRDDDIIAVAYPKCGITWTQYMIWEILHGGIPPPSLMEMTERAFPFTEIVGIEASKNMPSPRTIKFHSPYQLVPKNSKAKYVVIFRNPFDCCVSYYHHLKQRYILSHKLAITFDDFFDWFISGQIGFGDYFDFVLSWYARRKEPNVLILFYEQMKKDHEGSVLKIADFLGEKYSKAVRNDPDLLAKIIEYSSFTYMKEKLTVDKFISVGEKGEKKDVLPSSEKKIEFFRKGVVGDWKNTFSKEQEKRLVEKVEKKLSGTDIKDMLLPPS